MLICAQYIKRASVFALTKRERRVCCRSGKRQGVSNVIQRQKIDELIRTTEEVDQSLLRPCS